MKLENLKMRALIKEDRINLNSLANFVLPSAWIGTEKLLVNEVTKCDVIVDEAGIHILGEIGFYKIRLFKEISFDKSLSLASKLIGGSWDEIDLLSIGFKEE